MEAAGVESSKKGARFRDVPLSMASSTEIAPHTATVGDPQGHGRSHDRVTTLAAALAAAVLDGDLDTARQLAEELRASIPGGRPQLRERMGDS